MPAALQAFIDGLKAKNMSWVPIVDPAIMVDIGVGYRPYDVGLEMDIFIKDRVGVPYYGKVGCPVVGAPPVSLPVLCICEGPAGWWGRGAR